MQNVLDIKYKMEEQIKVEFARANEAYNLEVRKLQDFVSRKYGYEEKLRNLYKENLKIAEIKKHNAHNAHSDKHPHITELYFHALSVNNCHCYCKSGCSHSHSHKCYLQSVQPRFGQYTNKKAYHSP